jgi:hypothetical protein
MTIMIKKRGYWCLRVVYTLCQCPESDGRNFLAAIVRLVPSTSPIAVSSPYISMETTDSYSSILCSYYEYMLISICFSWKTEIIFPRWS